MNARPATSDTRGKAPADDAVPASDIAQQTLNRIRERLKPT